MPARTADTELPEGLVYHERFVSAEEEHRLLGLFDRTSSLRHLPHAQARLTSGHHAAATAGREDGGRADVENAVPASTHG